MARRTGTSSSSSVRPPDLVTRRSPGRRAAGHSAGAFDELSGQQASAPEARNPSRSSTIERVRRMAGRGCRRTGGGGGGWGGVRAGGGRGGARSWGGGGSGCGGRLVVWGGGGGAGGGGGVVGRWWAAARPPSRGQAAARWRSPSRKGVCCSPVNS